MKLMHAKRKRTDGSWTEKQYDVSRRLAGLASMASVSNSEATAEYFYDSEGFDTGYSLTLTNGVSFERILVRPRYMHHRITAITNSSSGATRNITYSYDDLDRPVSRGNFTFAYNSRGEVSQWRMGSYGRDYAYDGIGNETSYAANYLSQYTGIAENPVAENDLLEYSPNGDLLAHELCRYSYDSMSRLVSVSELRCQDIDNQSNWVEVVVASNSYDYAGRRVSKTTESATHTYFYDGWLLVKEVIANTNGTNDIVE